MLGVRIQSKDVFKGVIGGAKTSCYSRITLRVKRPPTTLQLLAGRRMASGSGEGSLLHPQRLADKAKYVRPLLNLLGGGLAPAVPGAHIDADQGRGGTGLGVLQRGGEFKAV